MKHDKIKETELLDYDDDTKVPVENTLDNVREMGLERIVVVGQTEDGALRVWGTYGATKTIELLEKGIRFFD